MVKLARKRSLAEKMQAPLYRHLEISDDEMLRTLAGSWVRDVLRDICEVMADEGVTQTALAKKVGVSKSQLNRWLTKRESITAKNLCVLMLGLGYEPLLTEESWARLDRELGATVSELDELREAHAMTLTLALPDDVSGRRNAAEVKTLEFASEPSRV